MILLVLLNFERQRGGRSLHWLPVTLQWDDWMKVTFTEKILVGAVNRA